MKSLTVEEAGRIRKNLFRAAGAIVDDEPRFPWHSANGAGVTASEIQSSQALAVDVFQTVRHAASRDRIIEAWMSTLFAFRDAAGPWIVSQESCVAKSLLDERRATQLDVLITSGRLSVVVECKFTEPDGGACSQTDRLTQGRHRGLVQCDGRYASQTNPVNGIANRCALSGKGIRYWDVVPTVLGYDPEKDIDRCPFATGEFQWMRNLVVAHELARTSKPVTLRPAFLVVYADGPFPMAKKVKTPEWRSFEERVNRHSVPMMTVSYQRLLDIAGDVASDEDRPLVDDLKVWVEEKTQVVARGGQRPHREDSAMADGWQRT